MAISNGINPVVNALRLNAGTNITVVGGTATGSVAIAAAVGQPANGSLYLRGAGTGEVWVMVSGVWTQLTVN